jgi:hypothetical protein
MTSGNESQEREPKYGEEPEAEREESDQTTGYGKPPTSTRFKKGVSGNPTGRPKGSLNVAAAFTKAMREKVVVNEHGKRKTVTKLEAAMKQVVNKSASGDLRAVVQVVALAQYAEAKQSALNVEEPAINEMDQKVIEGILKRFQGIKREQVL